MENDLGVRIQISHRSDPTADKAIEHIMIRYAIEECNFSGNILKETVENIREIRATNQEERFLDELNTKIDHHEKTMIKGELSTGIFVNAASVIMRLEVATASLDVENEMKV